MGFFGGSSVDLTSPGPIGSTTPNTGAFTTLSFAPANNATGFSNTGNSLTGSNAQSLVSLAQTWNTTGTPTAISLNVTDTASNTNSLLFDFKVGGASRLLLKKAGHLNGAGTYSTLRANGFEAHDGGSVIFFVNPFSGNVGIYTTATIEWGSGAAPNNNQGDVKLIRDAAQVLALRHSTNNQTFRLYNTYTSATNFERLNFRWASNEFILDAEKGSAGGTLRGIKIGSATSSLLGFYGVTPVDQPATVTDPTGGGTQDAEARTAINAIIDRLQELGLIA